MKFFWSDFKECWEIFTSPYVELSNKIFLVKLSFLAPGNRDRLPNKALFFKSVYIHRIRRGGTFDRFFAQDPKTSTVATSNQVEVLLSVLRCKNFKQSYHQRVEK